MTTVARIDRIFGRREHLSATTALSQMTQWAVQRDRLRRQVCTDVLYQRIPRLTSEECRVVLEPKQL